MASHESTPSLRPSSPAERKSESMTRRRKTDTQTLAPATISEMRGVRYLHLGTPWVQGAMRLSRPDDLELEYVRRMMAWLLLREPEHATRGHAVQLGLGAASITRFCHGVLRMRTTAVELNPTVIDACRLWFALPRDGRRLRVLLDDAGRYVADPDNAGTADVLCVDAYDHEAAAPVLDDEAFYRACHRLLAAGGVMSVNLFGRDTRFAISVARIQAAFGAGRVAMLEATAEGNIIVMACKRADLPSPETLALRAAHIETRFALADLPARRWLELYMPLPPLDVPPAAAQPAGVSPDGGA
jgi:spermidine synthase